MNPDYKRLDSVKIRNVNESVDLHDCVKVLLVRMLRKKHPNRKSCYIYTEMAYEDQNVYYPDLEIWLKDKYNKPFNRIVYEIQEVVTTAWRNKMNKRYKDIQWVEIPLKLIREKWEDRVLSNLTYNKTFKPLEDLRTILEEYVI